MIRTILKKGLGVAICLMTSVLPMQALADEVSFDEAVRDWQQQGGLAEMMKEVNCPETEVIAMTQKRLGEYKQLPDHMAKSIGESAWACSQRFFSGAWGATWGTISGAYDCASEPKRCRDAAVDSIRNGYQFVTNIRQEVSKMAEQLKGLAPDEIRDLTCEIVGSMAPGALVAILTGGGGTGLIAREIEKITVKLRSLAQILSEKIPLSARDLMRMPGDVLDSIRSLQADGYGAVVAKILGECGGSASKALGGAACEIPSLKARLGEVQLLRKKARGEALRDAGLTDRNMIGERKVPLRDQNGLCVALDANCTKFASTRETAYERTNASGQREVVLLQEHTYGHVFQTGGGYQFEAPHFNMRLCSDQVRASNWQNRDPKMDCRANTAQEHYYAVADGTNREAWNRRGPSVFPNLEWTNKCNRRDCR
jgi:hypothetical protein